jgi:hypothetical protein
MIDSVETGSNTSTVALRVVGSDKKGSLEYEVVKYGREYQGNALASTNDRRILSSERMLYNDYDRMCSMEEKNSGCDSQGDRR